MVVRLILIFLCLCSIATAGSVQLSWTAPGDDGNVGTAYCYSIRYSQEPITEENWDTLPEWEYPPLPEVAGTPQTAVITGLIQEQIYYFAIKTMDEAGNWSELSNVISKNVSRINPPHNLEWDNE
jgi:hypothetical protein